LFPNSSSCVQSVQKRHREIHNNYIRFKSDCFRQQGTTIRYRSNDGKCLFQVDAQSISHDRVVIGDEDACAERVPVDSLQGATRWMDPPDSHFEADASGFSAGEGKDGRSLNCQLA
jgi:hypothetical protein